MSSLRRANECFCYVSGGWEAGLFSGFGALLHSSQWVGRLLTSLTWVSGACLLSSKGHNTTHVYSPSGLRIWKLALDWSI
jgi:hypothetical protein